ncbi:hypothetical protein BKA81DRAFT_345069, partial [Phyllosticta paracitricarpa]
MSLSLDTCLPCSTPKLFCFPLSRDPSSQLPWFLSLCPSLCYKSPWAKEKSFETLQLTPFLPVPSLCSTADHFRPLSEPHYPFVCQPSHGSPLPRNARCQYLYYHDESFPICLCALHVASFLPFRALSSRAVGTWGHAIHSSLGATTCHVCLLCFPRLPFLVMVARRWV